MPIHADLGVDVKVVQQHELPGQGVMIGCDFFSKKGQAGITVAFLHVAEHPIVGAVLLNNVDNIFNPAGGRPHLIGHNLGNLGLDLRLLQQFVHDTVCSGTPAACSGPGPREWGGG